MEYTRPKNILDDLGWYFTHIFIHGQLQQRMQITNMKGKRKVLKFNQIKESICFTNPGSCCLKSPYAALCAGLSVETERLLKPSPLGPLSPSHSNFYQGFAVPSDVDVWMQRHSTAVTAFAAAM